MALTTVPAKDATGTTQNFIVGQDGSSNVASSSVLVNSAGAAITGMGQLDVGAGLIPGVRAVHKFGFNGTVPNGTFADIWAYGPTDPTYNWPTAAESFRIRAGGDANDTAAGTGARSVTFQFLDATGAEVEETIATNGTGVSAATSSTGRRFNRAFVSGVGTQYGSNTGQIIIENETTNEVVAAIAAGFGQTQLSQYTVPLGYSAYLADINVDVEAGTNKNADVRMWQRQGALETSAPFSPERIVHQWKGLEGALSINLKAYNTFPALTDLWLDAQGNGATVGVDASYDLFLVPT